jgi:glutathione S-transferase
MIVYGATLSPFVRKTLAAAAEKGIEIDHQTPPFGQPHPEFEAASPFRKIPALKDGDFTVCDSSAIIHYFEGTKPEPALIPSDAKDRARVIWFEEFADTIVVSAAGAMFFNRVVAPMFLKQPGDEEAALKGEKAIVPVLDYLEGIVPEPGGYLVGDRLTLADLAVASPFANLRHLKFDLSNWPKTKAWTDAMLERPSFKEMVDRESRIFAR